MYIGGISMRLLIIKVYLQIVIMLQSILLGISKGYLK